MFWNRWVAGVVACAGLLAPSRAQAALNLNVEHRLSADCFVVGSPSLGEQRARLVETRRLYSVDHSAPAPGASLAGAALLRPVVAPASGGDALQSLGHGTTGAFLSVAHVALAIPQAIGGRRRIGGRSYVARINFRCKIWLEGPAAKAARALAPLTDLASRGAPPANLVQPDVAGEAPVVIELSGLKSDSPCDANCDGQRTTVDDLRWRIAFDVASPARPALSGATVGWVGVRMQLAQKRAE